MSRVHDPVNKKRLAYAHERRHFAEYPHAARGAWRRARARGEGRVRAAVRDVLHTVSTRGAVDEAADAIGAVARAARVGSSQGAPLAQHVERQLARRALAVCARHFRRGYDSARDREGFGRVLASLVAGRSQGARDRAAAVRAWLEGVARVRAGLQGGRAGTYVAAFFRDEPAWEPRLRAWLAALDAAARRAPDGARIAAATR